MANVFRTVIKIITCIALFICPMPNREEMRSRVQRHIYPVLDEFILGR